MPLRVTCPGCQESFSVNESMRGKKVRCRECDGVVPVPAGKTEDGIVASKNQSSPVPHRTAREDRATPQRDKKAKSGLLPIVLIGGGVLAVLGLLGIGGVVGLYFAFRSGPDRNAVAIAQEQGAEARPIPNVPPVADAKPDKAPALPLPGQIDKDTVARVKRSTVYLHVTLPGGAQAEGSGFFAIEPGIVFTNAHVLGMLRAQSRPPANVDVVVNDGPAPRTLRGQVLGVDRATDLAVIRVADPVLPPPLLIDSARNLDAPQKVYFFGFPLGKQLGTEVAVGEGAVSRVQKDAAGAINQVQFHGDMQPGNSGGPVVDAAGRVVGVAVAIIKGTRINFAVPSDAVKQILEGRLEDSSFGEPYLDNNKAKLPVKFECLDPLGKVRSVRVDVWAGASAPPLPLSYQQPAAQPGDSPRQSVPVGYQNGVARGDVPLPAVRPGQVYWVQAVLENGAGVAQWLPAAPLPALAPLQRVAANLQMKWDQAGERTVHLKDTIRVTVHEGKNKFSEGLAFEADVLESVNPTPKFTNVRVSIGPNRFADELDGKPSLIDPKYSQRLRDLSPNFLVDVSGKLRERGMPNLNPKLPIKDRETLEMMLNRVSNAYEEASLYLPNRTMQPLESWQAMVPTIVGHGAKRKVLDIELTCTFEGTRIRNNRNEAVIRLRGAIKGREPGKQAPLGKVTGKALLDLDAGYLAQVTMRLNNEMDFGGAFQMVLTEDVELTRASGNPLNLVAVQPTKPMPPVPGQPDGPPIVRGKVIFRASGRLAANSAMENGRYVQNYNVKLAGGKTYVIDMKGLGNPPLDTYLRVIDSVGVELAKDDDSGGDLNARITLTVPKTGVFRIVATTFQPRVTGAFILTVTAKD